jgi:hypothetical protein
MPEPNAIAAGEPRESLEDLVDMAGDLKEEIRGKERELDALKALIMPLMEFRDGVMSAHAYGNSYKLTVQRKESARLEQRRLDAVRAEAGDEAFFRIFRWKYEPESKKSLTAALADPGLSALIGDAAYYKEDSPYFSWKRREDC